MPTNTTKTQPSNNRSNSISKKERKAKERRSKRLASIPYKCYVCNEPYTFSTAMNEQKFCSLKCEGKQV